MLINLSLHAFWVVQACFKDSTDTFRTNFTGIADLRQTSQLLILSWTVNGYCVTPGDLVVRLYDVITKKLKRCSRGDAEALPKMRDVIHEWASTPVTGHTSLRWQPR